MIDRILISNYNTSFTGKNTNDAMRLMDEIVIPLIDSLTPIPEIIKQTNFSRQKLDRWAIRKYGITCGKLYRKKQSEVLKNDFLEYRKNKTTLKEIGKTYGHDALWVRARYMDIGLDTIQNRNKKLMSTHIPWMLDAGYSLKLMKEQLNISTATIKKWIAKNIGYPISKYRKTNNIRIKTEI